MNARVSVSMFDQLNIYAVSHPYVLPQVQEKTSAVKEKSGGEKSSAGKKRTPSGKAKSEKESEVALAGLSAIFFYSIFSIFFFILHSQHISV